eukprot:1186225-Prorocentrum_minimum.AAC.2
MIGCPCHVIRLIGIVSLPVYVGARLLQLLCTVGAVARVRARPPTPDRAGPLPLMSGERGPKVDSSPRGASWRGSASRGRGGGLVRSLRQPPATPIGGGGADA